jgi:hypothetical protein
MLVHTPEDYVDCNAIDSVHISSNNQSSMRYCYRTPFPSISVFLKPYVPLIIGPSYKYNHPPYSD